MTLALLFVFQNGLSAWAAVRSGPGADVRQEDAAMKASMKVYGETLCDGVLEYEKLEERINRNNPERKSD